MWILYSVYLAEMANIQALLEQVQRILGQAPSSGTEPSTLLQLLVTSGGTTCTLAQGAGHARGENTIFSITSAGSHTTGFIYIQGLHYQSYQEK